jgi:hypothetical protein
MDELETQYASAWTELTGYVWQAQEDGHGINADDLTRYMTELKRRAVRRAWDALDLGEWPHA